MIQCVKKCDSPDDTVATEAFTEELEQNYYTCASDLLMSSYYSLRREERLQ